jgi:hypothetical protein
MARPSLPLGVRGRERLQGVARLCELVALLDVDAEGPAVQELGEAFQVLGCRSKPGAITRAPAAAASWT